MDATVNFRDHWTLVTTVRMTMSDFFDASKVSFRYEPFPIGRVAPMVEEPHYRQMVANWPAIELFEHMPRLGDKYSLSDKCHGDLFRRFVSQTPIWAEFDQWVRSAGFVREIMEMLVEHHIDLGYRPDVSWTRQTLKNVLGAMRGRSSHRGARLEPRWEFQMMPANGGHILPHTDSPSKIVTMTLSIIDEGEWQAEWGGGLDVNRAKHPKDAYNQLNRQASFDDMDVLDTIAFEPNVGVIFIKTFNSWHSVRPMRAPAPGPMRKNLIINIRST